MCRMVGSSWPRTIPEERLVEGINCENFGSETVLL